MTILIEEIFNITRWNNWTFSLYSQLDSKNKSTNDCTGIQFLKITKSCWSWIIMELDSCSIISQQKNYDFKTIHANSAARLRCSMITVQHATMKHDYGAAWRRWAWLRWAWLQCSMTTVQYDYSAAWLQWAYMIPTFLLFYDWCWQQNLQKALNVLNMIPTVLLHEFLLLYYIILIWFEQKTRKYSINK